MEVMKKTRLQRIAETDADIAEFIRKHKSGVPSQGYHQNDLIDSETLNSKQQEAFEDWAY